MKLVSGPVQIPILGHGLELLTGGIGLEMSVTGTLAEDTETGTDGREYAIFTIVDDGTQPAAWAGRYRISLRRLISYTTDLNGNCRIIRKGAGD